MGAKIGGDLDLSSATFHENLDVSNAVVERELRLGNSRAFHPTWKPSAWLVLRNASVGAVQDRLYRLPNGTLQDAWPEGTHLQLDGFTYKRLGGLGGENSSEMMSRPTSWYSDWLRRDASFSPQPYRQLATVFREAGADGKANEILYELRDREREEAWRQRDYGQWLWLGALKLVIGYGIGGGYFLALIWAGGFTTFGAWVLWSGSKWARETKSRAWCVWASFDEILPIVQLDKEHEELINEWLKGWRLYYFYVHRVVAYVLGSFRHCRARRPHAGHTALAPSIAVDASSRFVGICFPTAAGTGSPELCDRRGYSIYAVIGGAQPSEAAAACQCAVECHELGRRAAGGEVQGVGEVEARLEAVEGACGDRRMVERQLVEVDPGAAGLRRSQAAARGA